MKCLVSCGLVAAALLLNAAALPAHGWIFPGFSTAPPPVFTGAEGGGNPEQSSAEGGGNPDWTGPQGGGGGHDVIVAGEEPEPSSQPSGPVAIGPRTTPAATPIGRFRAAARPKSMARPWADRLHVPWTPVFLTSQGGYDKDVAAGLSLPAEEGGWVRRDAPSIVVVYDPSSESHRSVLAKLDADARFVAGSHLFNCFRLARSDGKAADVALHVFDKGGKEVGRLTGDRRLHQANRLLRAAYGDDLTKALPKVQGLIEGIAFCDHEMAWMEAKVICPDCGHERHDVKETIGQMEIRRAAFEKALAGMR